MSLILPYKGTYVNAKYAINDIDVEGIIKYCKMIEKDATRIDSISNNVLNASSSITPSALSIDDKTINGKVDEYCGGLDDVYNCVLDVTAQIKEQAIEVYNRLQREYNEEAIKLDNSMKNENNRRAAI